MASSSSSSSSRTFATYQPPVLDEQWLTEAERNATGLDASSYLLTNSFIQTVASGQLVPDKVLQAFSLSDISGFAATVVDNWQDVFTYNSGVCACIVIGFMMALIMPLAGLGWLWGRKRGQCGSQHKQHRSSWSDRVQRQLSLTCFVVFWAFSLWGLVWHFTASGIMNQGVNKLPANMGKVSMDVQRFMNNTVRSITHWTDVNLNEDYRAAFLRGLDELGDNLESILVNDIVVNSEMDIVAGYGQYTAEACQDFQSTNQSEMVTIIERLDQDLTPIEANLELFLGDTEAWTVVQNNCDQVGCDLVSSSFDRLVINKELIGEAQPIRDVPALTAEDYEALERATEFGTMQRALLNPMGKEFVINNQDLLQAILEPMQEFAENETAELRQVVANLQFNDDSFEDDIRDMIDSWYDAAYYSFMIPGYLLTIILFVYLVALILGLSAPVGSKRRKLGAKAMCGATASYFMVAIFFWVLTTVLFAIGVSLQKLGCDTVQDPANSNLSPYFENEVNEKIRQALNFSSLYENKTWDLPELLSECQDGKDLYELLYLDQIYDVKLLRKWRDVISPQETIDIINPILQQTVDDCAYSLSVPDEYQDLNDQIDHIDDLMSPVTEFVRLFNGQNNVDKIFNRTNLMEMLDYLREIQDSLANEADKAKLESLIELGTEINEDYTTFVSGPFTYARTYAYEYNEKYSYGQYILIWRKNILTLVEDASWAITPSGYFALVNQLDEDFVQCVETFEWFVEYSIDYMDHNVGVCTPLYDVLTAGVNYACPDVVDPFNSLWSGVGVMLVSFVPLLISACFVEGIFRRTRAPFHPYVVSIKSMITD